MGRFSFLKVALAQPTRLSEQDELELVEKYKAGDEMAYKKLRLSLRPLIEKAIADVIPSGNEVSASNLRMRAETKLPDIIKSFDASRGYKLKTYIIRQLNGNLRNATSENKIGPYVPRNQHPDLDRYKQAIRTAEMEHGKNPTEDQVRSYYPQDAATDFDKIKTYHVKSYLGDAVFGEDEESDGLTFKDQFTEGTTIGDNDVFGSMKEEELDRKIQQVFTPGEQQVIKMIVKDGKPFVETSLTLGVSTGDIRKIIRRWHELSQQN
ncbi:hypothetical protein AAXE64_27240 [Priestia megaterium]|uniref:hypothetical protein n=1 Tax=Priestia megaterium TaxID=1404 RepID=UPI003D06A30A